jgi:phosphatidate phosphatase PAH1
MGIQAIISKINTNNDLMNRAQNYEKKESRLIIGDCKLNERRYSEYSKTRNKKNFHENSMISNKAI